MPTQVALQQWEFMAQIPELPYQNCLLARAPGRLHPTVGLGGNDLRELLLWSWTHRAYSEKSCWVDQGLARPVAFWQACAQDLALAVTTVQPIAVRTPIEPRLRQGSESLATGACLADGRSCRRKVPAAAVAVLTED